MSAGSVHGGWWSRIRPSCVSLVTTQPSHSKEVTVIGRKPVIRNSTEDLENLVVWKTRCTKKEHQASCYLTRSLGYSKSRGLVVCRSLPCCHLFFMSCMTLVSDKKFHKFKTNLRRKIRTVLKRKGWSVFFFGKAWLPKGAIYTVTATTIQMAVNLGLVRVLHVLLKKSECDH